MERGIYAQPNQSGMGADAGNLECYQPLIRVEMNFFRFVSSQNQPSLKLVFIY